MAKKKSKAKKFIIIGIILVVVVLGVVYINYSAKLAMNLIMSESIIETNVEKGTVEVKITGNGVIEPLKRYEIPASLAGEVKSVSVSEGSVVKKDTTLYKVGSTNIKSPVPGTVITKNLNKGEYILAGVSASQVAPAEPLFVIADMSKLRFNLEVDELDIAKIQIGMEANITADALEGQNFTGIVTKIASEGKSTNGVTVYDVTVEIANYGALKIGMNVDANIIIDKKEDTLKIPMSVVNKTKTETYVYVKDPNYAPTKEQAQKQAQLSILNMPTSMSEVAGYKKVDIQTGLSNKDEIEIIGGLVEGDKVYSISTSKTLQSYMMSGSARGM